MPTKVKGTTGVDKVEAGAVITNPAFSGDATVSGSLTVGGVNVFSGPYRNLIINSNMQIAQRGTSVTGITGTGYYTVDRYRFGVTTMGTFTMSQDTDVPTGQGFTTSLKLSCTTADASPASADNINIQHRIEAQNLQHLKYGTASAESLTLSFWVKSNKTGTYTVWFYQPDDDRQISPTFTIDTANTWEKKTITVNGDTTGVIDNNNGEGLRIGFFLGAGSNFTSGTLASSWESNVEANRVSSSNVNLADSTSNYINITGVQLEVGEGASDFEFLPYDVQLQRCQRYYWQGNRNSVFGRTFNTANLSLDVTSFSPVSLRATPSITWSNGGNDWRGAGTSPTSDVTPANISIDGSGTALRWTQNYSAGTLSANYQFHLAGSPTLYVDAEL